MQGLIEWLTAPIGPRWLVLILSAFLTIMALDNLSRR